MRLYYGADKLVEKPLYNYGKPSNDYGLGFYLTDDKNIAKLWASKNEDGYLLTYDVDLKNLNICHLNTTNEKDILMWISILIKNRFSKEEYENNKDTIDWLINQYNFNENMYDLIIGYRADDSYFQYSRDFVRNDLSLEALSKSMKLGKLGIQYVLKSKKAFNCIELIDYEKIEHNNDYEIFRRKTLAEYHKIKKDDDIGNTFIRDIMRKYR